MAILKSLCCSPLISPFFTFLICQRLEHRRGEEVREHRPARHQDPKGVRVRQPLGHNQLIPTGLSV